MSDHVEVEVMPIGSLNSFLREWKISGRVTDKTGWIPVWSARGESRCFNFTITGSDGVFIGARCFEDSCGDAFDVIQFSSWYTITGVGGALIPTSAYYKTSGHRYMIDVKSFTVNIKRDERPMVEERPVVEVEEHPVVELERVKISDVHRSPQLEQVDIMAIVHRMGVPVDVETRDDVIIPKLEMVLMDESGATILLTVWGPDVDRFPREAVAGKPLILKKAVVRVFRDTHELKINAFTEIILSGHDEITRGLVEWYARRNVNRNRTRTQTGSISTSVRAGRRRVVEIASLTRSNGNWKGDGGRFVVSGKVKGFMDSW
uniref:REPA_OB_2 domain-containing protein n=1 Tax=Strongyloides papillosus TaxID=174720 RepID=A0A0N5C2S4_STREA